MPRPLTDTISIREAFPSPELSVVDADLARVLAGAESMTRGAEDGQLRHHLQRAVDGLIAARHRLRRLVTGALPEIQTADAPVPHEACEDRRYEFRTCPQCKGRYQLIDWGSARHINACGGPVPAAPLIDEDPHEAGGVGVGSMPHPAAGLSAPLVSLGQGDFRTDIHGDPRTGRLDVRA